MERVVKAVLMNKEGKLLLHLRDDKPSISYPNFWSLLGGGVEENETLSEALKREIKEEIDYNLGGIVFLDTFYGSEKLVYVYKSKIDKRVDELTLTEGQKLGFFSFEEVMKLKIPKILRDFLVKNKSKILD